MSAANCTRDADASTTSNNGVAGIGVSDKALAGYHTTTDFGNQILLSFMITACLALILSSSVILGEFRGKDSITRRKLLSNYSDSQLMQGIGLQS